MDGAESAVAKKKKVKTGRFRQRAEPAVVGDRKLVELRFFFAIEHRSWCTQNALFCCADSLLLSSETQNKIVGSSVPEVSWATGIRSHLQRRCLRHDASQGSLTGHTPDRAINLNLPVCISKMNTEINLFFLFCPYRILRLLSALARLPYFLPPIQGEGPGLFAAASRSEIGISEAFDHPVLSVAAHHARGHRVHRVPTPPPCWCPLAAFPLPVAPSSCGAGGGGLISRSRPLR